MMGQYLTMTSEELDVTKMAEKFFNSIRGFIVIEESGLPKYIEFLTEEQVDVILLAGLLTGLQALAEVISDEKIKTIETSNSIFIFKARAGYFYVIWIEKTVANLDIYDPIIMKLIARFEGTSDSDIDSTFLISNLTETPEYEKFGSRIAKFRSVDAQHSETYKKILKESKNRDDVKRIAEKFSGIDGVLIISDEGQIEHSEFPRGEPIFEITALTNFLVGLRKSIKNIDPGTMEEFTTENYRFIIQDKEDYFYVFEVIKGLANNEQLSQTMQKIISRYEGLRGKQPTTVELFEDFDSIPEHELLGRLSLEMKGRQSTNGKTNDTLERQTKRISFGDDENKWLREDEQMHSFMDIYEEILMVGIISSSSRYFIMRRTLDSNDWIQAANELELEKLLALTELKQKNEITRLDQGGKELLLARITTTSILLSVVDKSNSTLERFFLRMPNILSKISKNVN